MYCVVPHALYEYGRCDGTVSACPESLLHSLLNNVYADHHGLVFKIDVFYYLASAVDDIRNVHLRIECYVSSEGSDGHLYSVGSIIYAASDLVIYFR